MKKNFPILFILLALFICVIGYAACKAQQKTITIFHTSDNHVRGLADQNISYAKLASYVENYRRKHPNTLFLDSGDSIQGLSLSDVSKGKNSLMVMNKMGYNAMVPGNHEFDWGVQNFLSLVQETSFPIVAVNFIQTNDEVPMLPMYVIEEISGITIAILGVITPDMPALAKSENIAGYSFPDPTPILQELVPELKKEFDVVVVLAHMGMASENSSARLAENVPGIDIIIDGHDHTPLPQGMMVGNTLIANAGEYGEFLGEIKLTMYRHKIINKKASLIKSIQVNKAPAKQEIVDLIAAQKEEYAEELAERRGGVVATLPMPLNGKRTAIRAGQTNLTTVITDAILEETGADAVLISSGGIRQSLADGVVTEEDIYNVMPFSDVIVTVEVTGEELLRALEYGLDSYPNLVGKFPQVAGMLVSVDYQNPPGKRVQSVMIKEKILDPQQIYRIATSTYLVGGGDGYQQFKKNPVAVHGLQKDMFTRMLIKRVEANEWPMSTRIIDK